MPRFSPKKLCGWIPDLGKKYFDTYGDHFQEFVLKGNVTASRRMMLFEVNRKILGKDTPNYPQEIGDCTSFMLKNCIEYLLCCDILLRGESEEFKSIFPPYSYGTAREIGGMLGGGDGCYGSAIADAVKKFGVISTDTPGCPQYSGSVAKAWGRKSAPQEFKAIGVKHVAKATARIQNWSSCVNSVTNGYPVGVCSDRGFRMEASADGFHKPQGSWSHAMSIIGVDDEHSDPYGIILNSWGDVHGTVRDFVTDEPLPKGCLRVRAEYIDKMLKQGDSYNYSQHSGFLAQDLDKALFDMYGN